MTHPPILDEHRIAPAWALMSVDERAKHWDAVWGYYDAFNVGVGGRPDQAEVQAILDLHTPPELAQKYRY